MEELFRELTGLDIGFLVSAGLGGVLFVAKLILQLLGADHGIDADTDIGHGDAGHASSDTSFKVLTLHGLTGFFMMFGLVGFAMHRQSGAGLFLSLAGAVAAGALTVFIIGKLFSSVKRLQSDGTVDIVSAIGGEGTVYITIPQGGTGIVQVVFRNHMREFEAVSQNNEELKTGEHVRVVWVKGNTLVVDKI